MHFGGSLSIQLNEFKSIDSFSSCSHVRLTSPNGNFDTLLNFVKEVAMYCVDLRLDHLDWLNTADLHRLLSYFRILVTFHSGNVALSKRTISHDLPRLFPFLRYLTLLIPLKDEFDSITTGESFVTIANDQFHAIATSLSQMNQLIQISLIFDAEKKSKILRTVFNGQ